VGGDKALTPLFRATCGVTERSGTRVTPTGKPAVSKPCLRPPLRVRFLEAPATSPAPRIAFAMPVASHTRLDTIKPLRFSTSRFRCNSTWPPCPHLYAPVALRDRFSTRAFRSSVAHHDNPPWDFRDPLAEANLSGSCAENSSHWAHAFQQTPVHAEVLVRGPPLFSCLLDNQRQKILGYFGFQQTVAVLGEHRGVPHFIVQIQPYEPAE